nr:MAG: ORF1 [Torque teno midi virus]
MPFWWQRRKRWYYRGRRRPWYKRRTKYRKKRRNYRRRFRGPTRRRRRRRRKVRRKRQTLPVRQWQPDKITKCKIKGVTVLVLGADGTQFKCYTNEEKLWTKARTPGGGGFGVERYTLQYLYEENRFSNNIWTKSNMLTDLMRYLGCRFTLYRHKHTDFIVNYSRNLPMSIDKFTYMNCHPQSMLLARHKKIIPSRDTRPQGKNFVRIRIKPTKVMTNKWFFQEQACKTGLCLIKAAACNLTFAHIGSTAQNQIVSLFSLNTSLYANAAWGQAVTSWKPYSQFPSQITYTTAAQKDPVTWNTPTNYAEQISYSNGFFNSKWLQATNITKPTQTALPLLGFRYNAQIDDGKGNAVWFKSVLTQDYSKPKADLDLIIEGYPLWQVMYGFADFVKSTKPDPNFLASYIVVFESKYILPYAGHATHYYWVPIDSSFIKGQGPYNSPIFIEEKAKWFPTYKNQQESINAIVKAGPFIPRYGYDRQSTWELHGFYQFYFKWGGTFQDEEQIADPTAQGTYIVPTNIRNTIQIHNPEKQKAAALLHCWDYRRGMLTKSAIKRMCEDAETDTDFQTDADSHAPRKKKKKTTKELPYPPKEKQTLQKCLLSLFEENTSKEAQEEQTMEDLIKQQQQQQRDLRYNILKIISDIKQQQQQLQLHTGLIN